MRNRRSKVSLLHNFVNFGNALQIEKQTKISVCLLNKNYLLQSTPVNIYQFEEKCITRAIIHAYITCFMLIELFTR